MNISFIVGILLLGVLVYMWYDERKRRIQSESDHELTKSRTNLDEISKRLAANKVDYDAALGDVPAVMLDNIGKEVPDGTRKASLVADSRSGRVIDTNTGEVVGDASKVQPVFKDLPGASAPIGSVPSGS